SSVGSSFAAEVNHEATICLFRTGDRSSRGLVGLLLRSRLQLRARLGICRRCLLRQRQYLLRRTELLRRLLPGLLRWLLRLLLCARREHRHQQWLVWRFALSRLPRPWLSRLPRAVRLPRSWRRWLARFDGSWRFPWRRARIGRPSRPSSLSAAVNSPVRAQSRHARISTATPFRGFPSAHRHRGDELLAVRLRQCSLLRPGRARAGRVGRASSP